VTFTCKYALYRCKEGYQLYLQVFSFEYFYELRITCRNIHIDRAAQLRMKIYHFAMITPIKGGKVPSSL
jgi:hypothetical protein